MMKLMISNSVGFCGGVLRAVKLAQEALSGCRGNVYMAGELVHNLQVIEGLKKEGLIDLKEAKAISPQDGVLVCAHGLPCKTLSALREQFSHIWDGTCPHVRYMAQCVQQYSQEGTMVLLVGDRHHPEVIGISGWGTENSLFIVKDEEEIKALPAIDGPIVVMAQSTISEPFFKRMTEVISQRFPWVSVKNTLCASSKNRQASVQKLKTLGAQLVLVIGGKHSNNTRVLYQSVLAAKMQGLHISCADELELETVKAFDGVGIISGASTPKSSVMSVVEKLAPLAEKIEWV